MDNDEIISGDIEDTEEAFVEDGAQEEVLLGENDRDGVDLDEDMDEPEPMEDEAETPRQNAEAERDDSVQRFLGHKDSVYSIAISPVCDINNNANTVAVSGGGDDLGYIWNIKTGQQIHALSGHKDSICTVGFNFNGKLAATGSLDGLVKIWNVETGKLMFDLEGPQAEVEWIDWHPKGNVILAGSRDSTVWMWNTFDGACMGVFAGHEAPVLCGSFTPDGKNVVTGSEDATLRIWDPKTAQLSATIQGHNFHEGPINCLSISSNSNLVLTGSEDSTTRVSSTQTHKVLGVVGNHTKPVEAVGFSNAFPYFATGSLDHKLNIYDVSNLQLRGSCQHDDGITKLVWHPTQPLVFTTSLDRTVRVWDSRSSQVVKVWKGHQNSILDIALTKDGSVFATASDDTASLVFSV